ncbi:MAG: IS3 family transposase [Pseudobdellovibrio sp.]
MAVLAEVLGISESRVYFIIKNLNTNEIKEEKPMSLKDQEIALKIEEIVKQNPQYGYRKVYAILRFRMKVPIYRNKVYEIMRKKKLLLPASTTSKKLFKGVPFSLKVEAQRPNQLWGIDMTQIWCGTDGWGYMHAVIDHYDKTLLGYNFSRSCKAIGGVMALSDAASKRDIVSLELRSDNGCHYGAKIFREELTRLGINHTRTMVNTPKGNAVIERFFRTLKQECVWINDFKNFDEAKPIVDAWVQKYNSERPHQTLGYLTPDEFFEKQTLQKIS